MSTLERIAPAMRVILLGPPGAGKGTQAKFLASKVGVPHIASGDLFRYHQLRGTSLGQKAKEHMSQGILVPDDVTIAMVLERVQSPESRNGFLLDGFPRNMVQVEALGKALAAVGMEIDRAVLIMVPMEELVRRLSGRLICRNCQAIYHRKMVLPKTPNVCDRCGDELYRRPDDTSKEVRVRIQVYEDETAPLIDHYRCQGKLVEVDGVGTIEEVGLRALESLLIGQNMVEQGF